MKESAEEMYAAVGHLVLLATALDNQLNRITILLLGLTDATLLEPVIGSIDVSRKIELIKVYASKLDTVTWRAEIRKHVEAVESVNRIRNIAAHSRMSFDRGIAVLSPIGAAKLLKSIDLARKQASRTTVVDIRMGITRGEEALGSGENLIRNLELVAEERRRRD